LVAEIHLRTIL